MQFKAWSCKVNTISENTSKTSGVKFTIGTLGKANIDKL